MPNPIPRLKAAQQQGPIATKHTLVSLLQQQHPDSPLTQLQQQQLQRCCAQLATQPIPAESLLLAADRCFNYAYPAGGRPAQTCPRHPS